MSNTGTINNPNCIKRKPGRPKKRAFLKNFEKKKNSVACKYAYQKIIILDSNILNVDCDAIVNAAKPNLLGGGGIDGVIHNAAGVNLRKKCEALPVINKDRYGNDVRCEIGDCRVTDTLQTNLQDRFKHVFHTVGPDCRAESKMRVNSQRLKKCYESVLQNVLACHVKSIAFCCISTGIYGYPRKDAASVAFQTVVSWLEKNHESVEKIIFCTNQKEDFDIYNELHKTFKENNGQVSILPEITQAANEMSKEVLKSKLEKTSSIPNKSQSSRSVNKITTDKILRPLCKNRPVPLENNKENICFFNSVLQVLYSTLPFRAHVLNTHMNNNVIMKIKEIFEMMETQNLQSINTYSKIANFDIPEYDYRRRQQIGVCEMLSFLFENCFEKVIKVDERTQMPYEASSFGMFELQNTTNIVCSSCAKVTFRSLDEWFTKLKVNDCTQYPQKVIDLLQENLNKPYPSKDYTCSLEKARNQNKEGCGQENTSYMSDDFIAGDNLIFMLAIFEYVKATRQCKKKFPELEIEHSINHNGIVYDLQGIIWHIGATQNGGHYISHVKVGSTWFLADDSNIKLESKARFRSDKRATKIPYFLFYKKRGSTSKFFRNIPISSQSSNVNLNSSTAIDFNVIDSKKLDDDHDNSSGWITPKKSSKHIHQSDNKHLKTSNRFECFDETVDKKSDTEILVAQSSKVLHNLKRKRTQFVPKKERNSKKMREYETETKAKLRSTPEGKQRNQARAKGGMANFRATPKGKQKNQTTARDGMKN